MAGFGGYDASTVAAAMTRGLLFSADVEDASLANNGFLGLLFTTGSVGIDLVYDGELGGDSALEFFENPTVTANGTPFTPICRNRANIGVSTVTVFQNPTLSNDGTELDHLLIPGGQGNKAGGGAAALNVFWRLATATTYYLKLTNQSGGAQVSHLHIDFIETR